VHFTQYYNGAEDYSSYFTLLIGIALNSFYFIKPNYYARCQKLFSRENYNRKKYFLSMGNESMLPSTKHANLPSKEDGSPIFPVTASLNPGRFTEIS